MYFFEFALGFSCCALVGVASGDESADAPNVIIVFVDDLGYGDLGCYGAPLISTPRLDQMAGEGIRFTQFYVGASVCSASRASLLTGRYPHRHGVGGVFFPGLGGMNPHEVTIAEVVKERGYATACFGKWHLGDDPQYLPTRQGFDEYYGIPYSNDMYIGPNQEIADDAVFNDAYSREAALQDQVFVKDHLKDRHSIKELRQLADKVPLFEGEQIIEYPVEQSTLTERYFERTISFIESAVQKKTPFFVYLTPAMPHVPLFPGKAFPGKSRRGLYGDVVEEIDWYMGALLDYLDTHQLSENTVVWFTSDNGPWLGRGGDAGSSGPLRDGKFSNYEGGVRVPCIVRWPGHIPAGKVSYELVSALDLLPTVAAWASAGLPDCVLDGIDVGHHLLDPEIQLTRDGVYYLQNGKIIGVRSGDWKYLSQSGKRNSKPEDAPELFHLATDGSESRNAHDDHPQRVDAMSRLMDQKKGL